jgi:acyl-CoA synthetase (AMP-forming)/AMP-acid ligase II
MDWIDRLADGALPGSPAILDHDGHVTTYAALTAGIDAAAATLADHGLRAGDRMVLLAENCTDYVVLLLAAARLRAWPVPVNARITAPELDLILTHADPALMAFATASADAAAHAVRLGATAGAPDRQIVLLARPGTCPEVVSADPARQVGALLYTSGTTGMPKGVLLSHATLAYNARTACRMRGMNPDDRLLLALPGTHIMALSTAILACLHAGACLHLLPRFAPGPVLSALADGATVMPAVPAMYDALLRHLATTGAPLQAPRLRQIGTGGAPLDPGWKARIEAAFGLTLNNGYGLTEAGPGISSTLLGPARRDGSVGHAYPECEIRLAAQGPDGAGELLVRGPNVMLGYYRNPQATAATITPDGFLRTGDLARIDPDGAIHIVGRAKELIIRSGFNVYPPEVEAALSGCPGVVQVAVAGRAVPGNEEVVAFVLSDGSVTEDALRAWAADRLTGYKRPQHVVLVDELPMTPAGKVKKPELMARHAHRLPASGA